MRDIGWFERCVDEIASAQDVLPLAEFARAPRRPKTCAITFDDGYRSVLDVAYPVLRKRGLPHTVFVCTEVLQGGPLPWFLRVAYLIDRVGLDRVKQRWELTDPAFRGRREVMVGLKQLSLQAILEGVRELEAHHTVSPPNPAEIFLSAEEVGRLAAAGTTIGSHTHRHPILSLMSADEQRFEIEESARIIESITGSYPTEFAYPNGSPLDFNATTMDILRASGMRLAVTTVQRHVAPRDDSFALPRVGLTDGDSHIRRMLKRFAPSLSTVHRRERRLRSHVL